MLFQIILLIFPVNSLHTTSCERIQLQKIYILIVYVNNEHEMMNYEYFNEKVLFFHKKCNRVVTRILYYTPASLYVLPKQKNFCLLLLHFVHKTLLNIYINYTLLCIGYFKCNSIFEIGLFV